MEQKKEHKKGLVGTITFHVIILLLLVFLGFFTPLPLPGEEGILVNFGNSENGLGDREPSPARRNPQPPKTVQKEQPKPQQEKTTPPVTPPPPKKATPKPQLAKEVAMTQDYEKTAAIDAAEKKKKEEQRKRQQEIDDTKRKQELEDDRIKKEEDDRIRKQEEEIERKRIEEAEKTAKAEAEKIAREEAAKKKAGDILYLCKHKRRSCSQPSTPSEIADSAKHPGSIQIKSGLWFTWRPNLITGKFHLCTHNI